MPLSLSDHQLKIVMDAAEPLDREHRDIFLQRVYAILRMRGRFTNDDVVDVTKLALCGLIHTADSAAVMRWVEMPRASRGLRWSAGGPGRYPVPLND